jgi:hypothetical protein
MHRRPRLAWLLATVFVLPTWVAAQSTIDLERLAPATAIVTLGFEPDAGPPEGLLEAFADLGFDEAGDTFARLIAFLGADDDLPSDWQGDDAMAAFQEGLRETCAPASDALEGVSLDGFLTEGLLSVSVAAYAPLPQGLALARVGDPARAATLQDALVTCFGGPSFEQEGVALHVLGDGGDLPIVVARLDDVFIAGTDPDLVRGAIRRAHGSDEPSLADGALAAARGRLAPGGVDLAFDASAVADVIEGLAQGVPEEAAPLVERALAALRTTGAFAARLGWSDAGLRFEQVLDVAATPADPALARLLTEPRRAGRPLWLPEGTVATTATVVPVRAIVAYVDGWLTDLEPLTGLRTDLRALAADLLDVDLDAALLDWVGETIYGVTLEPVSTDLRTLVQGPANVVMVPVSDEAAARAGLELLGPALLRAIDATGATAQDLSAMADPFGGPRAGDPDQAALGALFGSEAVAVDTIEIDGVSVDRIRVGATLELGVAVIDGHLVIGSPVRALESVLATRAGAPDLLRDPAWRAVLTGIGDDVRDASISDVPAMLEGLAQLVELGAQPLAALARAGFVAAAMEPVEAGEAGLTEPAWNPEALVGEDLTPTGSLAIGQSVTGELTGETKRVVYELTDVDAGAIVEIEMLDRSGSVDTYLEVVDAETGLILFENDDAGGTDRSFVAFEARPGVTYLVVASSWAGFSEGPFEVTATAIATEPAPEAAAERPAPPTFAEVLQVTDLLPRALRLVAERSGLYVSTTTVEGSTVRTIGVLPLR